MDTKLRVLLATLVILMVGAPALTVGGNGPPDVPKPDNRCEVLCNKQLRQCLAHCNGPKADPACDAACWTSWQICQWHCGVLPPAAALCTPTQPWFVSR